VNGSAGVTGVRIVEFALESGAVCLAERHDVPQPQAICVLVHDRHADLDRMRQFANPLERYSICPVLLDLPGHGLSSGDADTDSMAAIESALVYAQREVEPVAVVAEGRSVDTLLRCQPLGSVSCYILISPRSSMAEEHFAETGWSRIPSLSILDPHDHEAENVASMVSRRTRANTGRVFAHKAGALRSGRPSWPLQAGNAASAFIAEQAAFWRAGQPHGREDSA
jgi:hypothetical protein